LYICVVNFDDLGDRLPQVLIEQGDKTRKIELKVVKEIKDVYLTSYRACE